MSSLRFRSLAVLIGFLTATGVARATLLESEGPNTLVVVGTVKSVDVRWRLGFDRLASYAFGFYEASIEVESADYPQMPPIGGAEPRPMGWIQTSATGWGPPPKPGDVIYVRYWSEHWLPLSSAIILALFWVGCTRLANVQRAWVRVALFVVVCITLCAVSLTIPLPRFGSHTDFPREGQRIRAQVTKDEPFGVPGSGLGHPEAYRALHPSWATNRPASPTKARS